MPVWGDYEVNLSQVLGRGGMSIVYGGRQISLRRPVAIKVLKRDLIDESPEFVDRFNREAMILAKIVDQHIVQVYGAGTADGNYYYAMEFVQGEDLAKKLKDGYVFSEGEILDIALSVARALEAAWKHQVVHRDIKPSNILITEEGRVKVMDFGLAKALDTNQTRTNIIMGTPRYISPEQAMGKECDIRSDIYSLGAVLYELATRQPPFTADDVTALLYKHINEPPEPPRKHNPNISETLELIILRMLAKNPEQRYQTPIELIKDLERVRSGDKLSQKTISLAREAARVRSRRPAALLAALAVVAFAAGGYYLFFAPRPSEVPPAAPTTQVPPEPLPQPQIPVHQIEPDKDREAFESFYKKGVEAFANGSYEQAIAHLESARTFTRYAEPVRADIEEKIRRAAYQVALNRAREALEARRFEDALAALARVEDTDEVRALSREINYRKYLTSAADREIEGQWDLAAEDYEKALAFTDEKAVLERSRNFCRLVHEANEAFRAKQYAQARVLFEKALTYERSETYLRDRILECTRQIEAAEAETRERRRTEWLQLVRAARDHFTTARWQQSLEALTRAKEIGFTDEEFEKLLAAATRACAAPAGMVYIPAGQATLGSNSGKDFEQPEHPTTTGEFYIDITEVTCAEYAKFLAEFKDHTRCHPDEPKNKDHTPLLWKDQKDPAAPVVGVDWYDAFAYAAWAGKRLPTEAEFEKAAGWDPVAGRKRVYPWGDAFSTEDLPSFFGCLRMGSGVLEWSADPFKPYPGSPSKHPFFGGKFGVARGGYTLEEEAKQAARVSTRVPLGREHRSLKLGFRCVKDVGK